MSLFFAGCDVPEAPYTPSPGGKSAGYYERYLCDDKFDVVFVEEPGYAGGAELLIRRARDLQKIYGYDDNTIIDRDVNTGFGESFIEGAAVGLLTLGAASNYHSAPKPVLRSFRMQYFGSSPKIPEISPGVSVFVYVNDPRYREHVSGTYHYPKFLRDGDIINHAPTSANDFGPTSLYLNYCSAKTLTTFAVARGSEFSVKNGEIVFAKGGVVDCTDDFSNSPRECRLRSVEKFSTYAHERAQANAKAIERAKEESDNFSRFAIEVVGGGSIFSTGRSRNTSSDPYQPTPEYGPIARDYANIHLGARLRLMPWRVGLQLGAYHYWLAPLRPSAVSFQVDSVEAGIVYLVHLPGQMNSRVALLFGGGVSYNWLRSANAYLEAQNGQKAPGNATATGYGGYFHGGIIYRPFTSLFFSATFRVTQLHTRFSPDSEAIFFTGFEPSLAVGIGF